MNAKSIAERVKLCTLTTGMWRATRLHPKETAAERQRHNTDAAKVLVRISDHKALKDLAQLHNEAYRKHRALTVPTIQDGMRMLPVCKEFEHSDTMQRYGTMFEKLTAAFLADYDQEKAHAPARLNGLYDATMWPAHSIVAAKFTFKTHYLACPSDGAWGEWLEESARAAEEEVKERLTSVLQSIVAGCRGALHADAFDKLKQLLEVLPDLNLNDDPQIALVVAHAKPIAQIDPETLRDSKPHRQRTAELVERMVGMMGGPR